MSPHDSPLKAARYISDFFLLTMMCSGAIAGVFGMLLIAKLAWQALLQ